MVARQLRARADDDRAGFDSFLRRTRADKKRAVHNDAQPDFDGRRFDDVDDFRL